MKLDEFEIRFDNARGVFAAGQHVSGHVVVKLTKPMKMRCIELHFEGRAKSHWEVRQGRSKTDYRAGENYITENITLFGTGQSSTEHPSGYHSYPFRLLLSETLPSSFEGRRGYVRYFCKATINRPWKFDEHIKRAFTVIHHLDLNAVPTAAMPLWGEKEATIEGCCCTSGTLHASLTLNKTGYVPGEPIDYTVEINNQSDSDVMGLELDLKQTVKYTGYSDSIFSSGHPKFHTKVDNFPLYNGPFFVRKNCTERLSKSICVPALPPSKLDGCGIIDITYLIVMQPIMRWSSLRIEKEIIIGTIPLQSPIGAPPPFSEVALDGLTSPSAPPEDFMMPPPYQEPPPSYEESVFGRVEIRDENDDGHTEGLQSWAPSYPYYHWDPNTRHFQMVATTHGTVGDSATPNPPITTQPMGLQDQSGDAFPPCPPYNQL
ncbi:arrestin domain-containing protein 17 [Aplysia californica]|uniref:Arrestin domain-containing protein 17 n=1 Tax=Aplysia californica TaxID=6500 RepID=A0ABM0ZXW4_APLCA|nr:arrestin domain-containing protein 17 [Aplysia californica]